ncbi:MAG: tetratricopeptide repeat protein [Polyangiales bacterium]
MTVILRACGWTLLALSVLFMSVSSAQAQSIKEARSYYMQADFDRAVESLNLVLQKDPLPRSEAAQAHRYLATLNEILGDSKEAAMHVRAAVALEPSIGAAPGSPQSIIDAFNSVRTELKGEAAQIYMRRENSDGNAIVTATLSPEPKALADKIAVRCKSGRRIIGDAQPVPTVSVTIVSPDPDLSCEARVLTVQGGVLLRESSMFTNDERSQTMLLGDGATERDTVTKKRKKWPWIVAAVGVAAAGGAVAAVLLTKGKSSDAKIDQFMVNW